MMKRSMSVSVNHINHGINPHDPITTKRGGAAMIKHPQYISIRTPPKTNFCRKDKEGGFSLLTVLFSLMILMSMMASISDAFLKPQLTLRALTKSSINDRIAEKGYARISLLAGEAMLDKGRSKRTDIPKLDGTLFTITVDDTPLIYRLYDQEGLIDLNLAPPKLIELYFERLGMRAEFTQTFLERRKTSPQTSLKRFQGGLASIKQADHPMAELAIIGSDQGRLSYQTTSMELLSFLAGQTGERGSLITKIGRVHFKSIQIEEVIVQRVYSPDH